jgi:hypothetical protein
VCSGAEHRSTPQEGEEQFFSYESLFWEVAIEGNLIPTVKPGFGNAVQLAVQGVVQAAWQRWT